MLKTATEFKTELPRAKSRRSRDFSQVLKLFLCLNTWTHGNVGLLIMCFIGEVLQKKRVLSIYINKLFSVDAVF